MPFNLSDKSILVVDDSSIMRMFVVMNRRRMLRVNITEAVNGRDALAKLTQSKFDLLLTDMNMPEMGGAELVRFALRSERTEARYPDRDHHDHGRDERPGPRDGTRRERLSDKARRREGTDQDDLDAPGWVYVLKKER
jgi:hypothetical protein